MLIIPPQIKVFASLAATDMRKSFHGLTGIVEKQLGQQIEDGNLFLFFNRRRDRLKVLFFTGDGTVILYKHLERGTFESLQSPNAKASTSSPKNCLTLSTSYSIIVLIDLAPVPKRCSLDFKEDC